MFAELAAHSASAVKSNLGNYFGNLGGINPFIFPWARL